MPIEQGYANTAVGTSTAPAWTRKRKQTEKDTLAPASVPSAPSAWLQGQQANAPAWARPQAGTQPNWLSRWMSSAQQQPGIWQRAMEAIRGASAGQQAYIQYNAPIGPTAAGGNLPASPLPAPMTLAQFQKSRQIAPWAAGSPGGTTVAGGYHGHGSPTSNPYYWTIYPMLPPATQPTGGGGGGGYRRRGRGKGGNYPQPPAWTEAPTGFSGDRTYRPLTNWTIG